jgi:hypothetical protein
VAIFMTVGYGDGGILVMIVVYDSGGMVVVC